MKLGLQLYNFREELQEDFRGTLKKIAALGFDGVEFYGYHGDMSAQELADYLKELNLECAGTMFSAENLLDENNEVYEYAKILNSPAVTISMMTDFTKALPAMIETCQKIGANAAKNNTVFSYHNHWAEFALIDGETALEQMLKKTDPKQVRLELDVCWLTRGGKKPVEFMKLYKDRIHQIHLKDIKVLDDPSTTSELGTGVIDLKGVIEAPKATDCEWLIYEQDNTKLSPLESAARSMEYLKKNVR